MVQAVSKHFLPLLVRSNLSFVSVHSAAAAWPCSPQPEILFIFCVAAAPPRIKDNKADKMFNEAPGPAPEQAAADCVKLCLIGLSFVPLMICSQFVSSTLGRGRGRAHLG